MDLLLFGGNSIHNKDWVNQASEELSSLFEKRKVHHYLHWQKNEQFIDIDAELKELAKEIKELKNYAIFAKSIGTVLSAFATKEGVLHPKKCVFLGIPMLVINKNKDIINDHFKSIKVPILFIQNRQDPYGSAKELNDYLKELNLPDYRVEVLPGNTHSYTDFDKIKELIAGF